MSPISIVLTCILSITAAYDYQDDLYQFSGEANDSVLIGAKELLLNKYYNHTELTSLLANLETTYGDIMKVATIGKSAVDGLDIYAVEISRDVRQERKLLKPMFKYVANMHGDEAVGYALMVFLIQFLVYNDGVDARITRLLNITDIWIVPSLNPGGYSRSQEGLCGSLEEFVGRRNGHGVDLNRNFPDLFENDTEKVYEPETIAIATFIRSNPFVLSGNLHGGAVVASYPFDNSPWEEIQGLDSPTPDDDIFRRLALDYASRNRMMAPGTACGNNFQNGVTNGNQWYKVPGGMQDYNYVTSNCFEVTFELSCCKYPLSSQLPIYWGVNIASMLKFMENTRRGVYGLVKGEFGKPLQGVVSVEGRGKEVKSTPRGEYWRLLNPGRYVVEARAHGYKKARRVVEVTKERPYVRLDFALTANTHMDSKDELLLLRTQKFDEKVPQEVLVI